MKVRFGDYKWSSDVIYVLCLIELLLLQLIKAAAINCSTIVDCRTCTLSTDFLIPCQWCLNTRRCVSAWNVTSCKETKKIVNGYNCPLSPPARFTYLDDFARTRALPFIAAANADTEQQIKTCLDNNIVNTSFVRRYSIPCDFVKSNCGAFLAFSKIDNAVVVTFRGTNGPIQVFIEAINSMLYAQKDFEPVGGKVLSYFYDAFFRLWKGGLEADMRETIARHSTAELWIFGHSFGGAIGALTACWTSRMGLLPMERIRFISFGQPRTGNIDFAQIFDDLVPYKYRVIHRGDLITKLPAKISISDSSLFHHRYEVWYNNDMQEGDAYEVCEGADSAACSAFVNDNETLSSTNHLQYFNVNLFFQLVDHRFHLYYLFGLACLIAWLAFNFWVLRDYFFPCWFPPIYTETGLSELRLRARKREIVLRQRIYTAIRLPLLIGVSSRPYYLKVEKTTNSSTSSKQFFSSDKQHKNKSTLIQSAPLNYFAKSTGCVHKTLERCHSVYIFIPMDCTKSNKNYYPSI